MPTPFRHHRTLLLALTLLPCAPAFSQDLNLFEQVSSGGVGIIVIAGLSVLALAVAIERLVRFRSSTIAPESLLDEVMPLWREGQFGQVLALAGQDRSVLGRIVRYMAEHRHLDASAMAARVADIASVELRLQQQKAYALGVVATIAPIVGLLGTVIGMIEAFHVIAYAGGMGDPTLLAGGISKALVNTAAGLSVALPSLGMHHFFRHRMVTIGIALERQVNRLLDDWFMAAAPQAVTHAH